MGIGLRKKTIMTQARGELLPPNSPTVLKVVAIVTTLILLTGCGISYPLDIPEEEWQAMSQRERTEARLKQGQLERAEEQRREAEAAARAAKARERTEELSKARREADYGQRVQCVLRQAEGNFAGEWRSIESVTLDLVTGVEVEIELSEVEDGFYYTDKGYASFNGQVVQICDRSADTRRNANRCARLLGTFKDFNRGIHDNIRGYRFLRGHLRCDLVPWSRPNGDVIIYN